MPGYRRRREVDESRPRKEAVQHLYQNRGFATRNVRTRDCQVAAGVTPRCREDAIPQRHDMVRERPSHAHRTSEAAHGPMLQRLWRGCLMNVARTFRAGMWWRMRTRLRRGRRMRAKRWRGCLFEPQASTSSLPSFTHQVAVRALWL